MTLRIQKEKYHTLNLPQNSDVQSNALLHTKLGSTKYLVNDRNGNQHH